MKLRNLLEAPIRRDAAERAAANNPGALIGFEFELSIPERSSLYTRDAQGDSIYLSRITDLNEFFFYFDPVRGSGRSERSRVERDFYSFVEKKRLDWADANYRDYLNADDEDDPTDDEVDEAKSSAYFDAENKIDISETEWLRFEYGSWYNFAGREGFQPIYGWENDTGNDKTSSVYMQEVSDGGDATREAVANALSRELGIIAKAGTEYHNSNPPAWWVVPDGSVTEIDAEVVTYPMPFKEAKATIDKMYQFVQKYDIETDESTGLHINISVPGIKNLLDPVKLVLMMGEKFALQIFGRGDSMYAKPQITRIINAIGNEVQTSKIPEFNELRKIAETGISKYKHQSINLGKLVTYGYIEIRIAGGDYFSKADDVLRTIDRIMIAVDSATNPTADRKEYARKLANAFNVSAGRKTDIQKSSSKNLDILFSQNFKPFQMRAFEDGNATLQDAIGLVVEISKMLYLSEIPRLGVSAAGELLLILRNAKISVNDIKKDPDGKVALTRIGLSK